jgi:hypothetical protein
MTCSVDYPHSHEIVATSPDGKQGWTIWATYADGKPTTWDEGELVRGWTQTNECLGPRPVYRQTMNSPYLGGDQRSVPLTSPRPE